MAGIQCCCRRLFLLNTSRLINKNGVQLQLSRKRHHLAFQVSSLQNRLAFQKSKLVFNTNKLLLYRLASTNITEPKEPVSNTNLNVSEVKNESQKLNNEPEIVASSNANVIDESLLPPIPSTESEIPQMDFISMGLKEPTFESLGLGSWWPSGLVQQVLEYLHIHLDLPWWESILIVTLVMRTLLFPFNLKSRRQSIHMVNHMPNIAKLQDKISNAKLSGDYYSVSLHTQELQNYIQKEKISPFSFLRTALIQGPFFISMYYGLKGMANVPVESLKTGGLFWFEDLTEPDPYYILPVLLAASLLAVVETGSDGNPAKLNSHYVKWLMRGIPAVVFLFSLNFAACITWYWTISNSISLAQAGLYKIPAVKKFLKLPSVNVQSSVALRKNQKGFIQGFKEGIENAKITTKIQERDRMNLVAFQKAGSGPVPRTFKKNPLLQSAKKAS